MAVNGVCKGVIKSIIAVDTPVNRRNCLLICLIQLQAHY